MIAYEPPRAATHIAAVDLSGSFADPVEQARAAREIHRACRETGFFYVTGHGVPQALLDAQIAQTLAFFAQNEAAKAAVSVELSPCRRGYEATGRQVLDAGSAADFKESFMLARDLPAHHPWVLAGLPMQGANQWPENLPGFRAQMEAYQAEMIRLGRHLMACLALSVDLAADWFADGLADPQVGVRLLSYPPQPQDALGNLLGAGAHTDWGSITILLQDDMAGLEVRGTDGDWIEATPIPGSFVINIGQMMERFTGGLYKANLHRVRNNHAARARNSVATFFELEPLYRMETAPTCVTGADRGSLRTIGEHLEDMARASYAA
ncbi:MULTISPECIES: isopenicillin N synthase family oxygenase [unclassified Novosphingobium]|uniref:isopenicillin N synthase family dioxygenase n=1 Tax=unclassified Novosphingobium TaxID=2644732 RepID=UPI00135C6A5C|nr:MULTISPECIES: 2-oxoglutarate and iron-dependent oxygenase domain-containing protein [unclassified Novosphingobium]